MKTIFITGTSSGLGKAAVKLFHSKGWNVIATMRDLSKAQDFEGMERVTVLPLDISKPDHIKTAVTAAVALGNVDVVLNNAAYGFIGPMETVTDEQLLTQVNTNLLGAIRITQAFIPHFRTRKTGLFINITSMAGFLTFPFASLYHAVKYGLQGWSEGMSYELAPFGIAIKTVAPGYITSEFGSNAVVNVGDHYKEPMELYIKNITSPRMAEIGSTSEEIADVVYEAATDQKDQVHYIAGKDANALHDRRQEIGPEAYRLETTAQFLS